MTCQLPLEADRDKLEEEDGEVRKTKILFI